MRALPCGKEEVMEVLRVLLVKEFDGHGSYGWTAVGLEKSLLGHGDSIDEALDSLRIVMLTQATLDTQSGREPFECLCEAPADIQEAWDKAWKLQQEKRRKPSRKRSTTPTIGELRVA